MKNLIWGLFAFATLAHAQGTVTDIDGNTYDYLTYGTQQWTVENAATETYRDGTPIPQVTDATQWSNLTTGAWCYYDNDPTKGKLYNWYAVAGIHDNDPNTPNKEFAPDGWHVPTDAEWTTLEEYLIANGYNYDGTFTGNKIAKSLASTSYWDTFSINGVPGNNQAGNNSSNFNILPNGYRNLNGTFYEFGFDGIIWSSSPDDLTHSWNRIVYSNQIGTFRNNGYAKSGCSVRFIKNSDNCSAPTGDAEQTFCTSSTVADLTATGDNIQWYDAATGGNFLDSTTALADGQMVYATQTVNGCESTDRLAVTVSIQEITITASATEVCAGESVDLSVDLNFPTICDMQINLTDIPLGQEIPGFTYGGFYNEHYYYVYNDPTSWTDGEQICRENGGYLVCINDESENTFVSNLTNNNIWIGLFRDPETCEFRWLDCIDINYTNWRPGEPNSGPCGEPYTQIIRGCSFGYNTWNNLGNNSSNGACYSNMVPIMEIDPEIYQTFDPSTTYLWSTGDTTETITVTPIETTEYWVDVTTNGVTCREYVTISVNDLPEAPTGESVNYFINCDSFSPTLDDAIATLTGDNIKLYDAAVGGNLLDPNSNIIDGQVVYASQTLDSCESSDRLEIQLNLYTLDTPVTDAPNNTVSFCNEQNLTILDLAPAQTATDRLWYETATSTTPIAETTPLVNGVTYYVSNYDIETGCESDRLAMTVEINNPEAPTGDAVQSFCDNVTVSDLSASGSNIQWYDAATGGNVLDPDSALSDGQLLYASQTENSCESVTRLEVSVEIDIIPDPILITTELEFCLAREATLADLEVDEQGFALEWYDSFSGGNMLPMDTLLEDGVSYYATLYDAASGCESLMRLEVVPTVIPCEVVIYNAISLNDNGINDHMVIENAEYFPDNSLEIYNRDGHLLYSQTQYGIGDNLFRGIANVSGIYGSTLSGDGPRLPTGSYLYVFKYFNPYEQQEYTLKGFLTINSN